MSKVTPSALRGLSVAAGTVSLAAVGAAVAAGPAAAAGLPGLGGLPLSTNALSAVKGLVVHNPGQIAGMPIAGLPVVNQLPQVMDSAAPGMRYVPGLSNLDLGAPAAQTRSRLGERPQPSLAHTVTHPAIAAPAAPAPAIPPMSAAPAAAAAPAPSMAAQMMNQAQPQAAAPAPAKSGPLENVTDTLPVKNLPVVGGLAGNLGGLGGLSGLPVGGLGGLTHFG
jgi:hypothetical protein